MSVQCKVCTVDQLAKYMRILQMNPASVFVSYKLQMCKHEGGTASSRMNIIIILSGTLNRLLCGHVG